MFKMFKKIYPSLFRKKLVLYLKLQLLIKNLYNICNNTVYQNMPDVGVAFPLATTLDRSIPEQVLCTFQSFLKTLRSVTVLEQLGIFLDCTYSAQQ